MKRTVITYKRTINVKKSFIKIQTRYDFLDRINLKIKINFKRMKEIARETINKQ